MRDILFEKRKHKKPKRRRQDDERLQSGKRSVWEAKRRKTGRMQVQHYKLPHALSKIIRFTVNLDSKSNRKKNLLQIFCQSKADVRRSEKIPTIYGTSLTLFIFQHKQLTIQVAENPNMKIQDRGFVLTYSAAKSF